MAKPGVARKILLGLGVCLLFAASMLWLNRSINRNSLQAWMTRMSAQGEKFKIDELTPPPPPKDATTDGLLAAANRLQSRAFAPGNFVALDFIAPGKARASWMELNALQTVLAGKGLALVKHPGTNLVGVTKK